MWSCARTTRKKSPSWCHTTSPFSLWIGDGHENEKSNVLFFFSCVIKCATFFSFTSTRAVRPVVHPYTALPEARSRWDHPAPILHLPACSPRGGFRMCSSSVPAGLMVSSWGGYHFTRFGICFFFPRWCFQHFSSNIKLNPQSSRHAC